VERWLEVLRQEHAAVAFNAVEESSVNSSADALAQLVKAQATTSSKDQKPSITVGIVGFPSVGRASVLRSLRQSKELASNSNSTVKFYVNLGALLSKGGHGPIDSLLRSKLLPGDDLISATASILMRCKQQTLMVTYSVPRFDTGIECLASLARQQGHLFKGGVPDTLTAARSFLRELGSGKSPFFTSPPSVKKTVGGGAVGYGLSAEDDGFVLDEMVFSSETTGFSFALAAQKVLEEDPEDSGDEVEEEDVPMLVPAGKEGKQVKSKKQIAPVQDMDESEDDEEEEEEEEEEVAVAPVATKRGAKSMPIQKRPVKKAKKSATEEDGDAPYTFGEFA
jgi:nuclear GTP-binding protein